MTDKVPDSERPPHKAPQLSDGEMVFRFFNEVGIISQLSSALFNKRMPRGLHVSHFAVLNHMTRRGDGVTPLKLANAFQVTKATMTHTLSVLGKGGFVRIEPNPKDARSKLVFITDAGRALRDEAMMSLREPTAELLKLLRADDMREALETLIHVRETLDDNRDV